MKSKEISIIKSKLEQMSLTIYQIVHTVIHRIISSEEKYFEKRILKYTVFRLHLPSGNYFKNKITTKTSKLHSFFLFLVIILVLLFWNRERRHVSYNLKILLLWNTKTLEEMKGRTLLFTAQNKGRLTHRSHRGLITARDKITASCNYRWKLMYGKWVGVARFHRLLMDRLIWIISQVPWHRKYP